MKVESTFNITLSLEEALTLEKILGALSKKDITERYSLSEEKAEILNQMYHKLDNNLPD